MSQLNSTLGFLIPEFPSQTHAFFWREINAIRSMGTNVQIISTRKPDFNSVKHDFVMPASEQTYYLHPPKIKYFILPFLNMGWTLKALTYVKKLDGKFINKLKALYFIFLAAAVLDYAKKNNIRHIHGHSCADAAHLLALAGLHNKLTYSLTLHGGLDVYGDNHKNKMINAAFVATVTNPLKKEVQEVTDLIPDRVPVISMGVNLDKFSPEKRVYEIDGPLQFITVARLSIGKGHEYSLEALRRLKDKGFDFKFLIVGGGPTRHDIENKINSLGINDNVELTGSLGEDEVLEKLMASDVLLLTSFGLFEAAPVAVMEAMASGIPTITSIIGGTRDMIDQGVNGYLVEQQNVDHIEKAMLEFSENRGLIEQMGKSARVKAEQVFDYKLQAKLLVEKIKQFSSLV